MDEGRGVYRRRKEFYDWEVGCVYVICLCI